MEEEGYNVATPVDPDSPEYQEIAEQAVDAEGSFAGSGGGDFESDGSGEEGSIWTDIQSDVAEHDSGGSDVVGESTESGSEQDSGNAGDSGNTRAGEEGNTLDVQISGQPISVDVESFEAYEGVTSEDFATYSEMVIERLDAVDAMMVVLMVAIFLCAGISAVDTLVRRFEKS